ncbi:MAG: amidohydrolase [Acidothermales bacterium]|nr:amidohydrolase [Acidothermales bacterium]
MGASTDLLAAARSIGDRTIELRRTLHRHPEIGLDLPRTQQVVLDEIADLGPDVRMSERTSAIVAVLSGDRPGPTVILRGDMDALPLREDTGLSFASEVPGAMHACGHDTHVAMLAGAARLLSERRDALRGKVAFFFQPGEEGSGGAKIALDEGLLDFPGEEVAAAYALHITTSAPVGVIAVRPGPQFASADTFTVTVHGRGGHASTPVLANDPLPVACEMVLALQTVMTRRFEAFEPVVLTVSHIDAGTTDNVIPADAMFEGTIRTFSADVRRSVHAHLERVTTGVAAAHDMTVDTKVAPGYPTTMNDPSATDRLRTVAADVLGPDKVHPMDHPTMGAEDFSYVLQRYPGAIAFLGACPPDADPTTVPWNHSNLVVFDEDALPAGVAMYAGLALSVLAGGG